MNVYASYDHKDRRIKSFSEKLINDFNYITDNVEEANIDELLNTTIDNIINSKLIDHITIKYEEPKGDKYTKVFDMLLLDRDEDFNEPICEAKIYRSMDCTAYLLYFTDDEGDSVDYIDVRNAIWENSHINDIDVEKIFNKLHDADNFKKTGLLRSIVDAGNTRFVNLKYRFLNEFTRKFGKPFYLIEKHSSSPRFGVEIPVKYKYHCKTLKRITGFWCYALFENVNDSNSWVVTSPKEVEKLKIQNQNGGRRYRNLYINGDKYKLKSFILTKEELHEVWIQQNVMFSSLYSIKYF